MEAAETGAVVNALIGHQSLQGIHRLQTGHTGLSDRQLEVLHEQRKAVHLTQNAKCVCVPVN